VRRRSCAPTSQIFLAGGADDAAFADYTIVGVPVGPDAAAAPEPDDAARLRRLGFAGYRKAKRNGLLAA
jgi:hypothetical protein